VVKNSQDHISSVFSLKIHRQNNKNALRWPLVWFLSFRAVPKTALKSPNSSASVLKTSSH